VMAQEKQEQEKQKKVLKKKKPSQEDIAKVKAGEERLAKYKAENTPQWTTDDYNKAMEAQFRATARENTSKDKRLFDSYANITDMNASYIDSARVNKDLGGKSKFEPEGDRTRRQNEEKRKRELKKPPFDAPTNLARQKKSNELVVETQTRVNTLEAEFKAMSKGNDKTGYEPKEGVDSTKHDQKWAEFQEAERELKKRQKISDGLKEAYDKNTVFGADKELKF
tara:strand:- start:9150 stop:9821 length:672 start_codon:yes stop_codon:yes gene_type:complete